MSCNISIPKEDIIEAVREELAKEFISIENGDGNNTTLNSPNIKGDVTFDSEARDALCSALAECVDEKLKALEDELDGKIEDTEAALRQAIADAKEDLEGDIDLLRKSFEDSQKQQDEAFDAKIAAQEELLELAIAAGDEALDTRIDGLDDKVDQQREDLEKAIEAGDKALDTRIDGLDDKVDQQREDLEKAIEAGDEALDTRIDGLDDKVDHQREDLEKAIAAGDDALGARIDNLDGKVDHQREDLEKAIAAGDEDLEKAIEAGDKALGARIDNLDGKVDHQREDLEQAIEAGDDALGARIDGLDCKVDQQREDLEKAIAAGDKALDTRIDGLDDKVDQQREGLEQAIAAGDDALDTRIDNLDGKVDHQREDLEQAIAAGDEDLEKAIAVGDKALGARIDGLDGKVDQQREGLEKAIEVGDGALDTRIDVLDDKVDQQREGLEKEIAAGDRALDTRIDVLDDKVDQQREGLEKAIEAGDDALGARIDGLDDKVDHQSEDLEKAIEAGKITSVTRDADTVTIELIDGTKFPFSVKDSASGADRPVKFAPSANGNNIEITLADGSVLDMSRQEFAEWLAGKDSPITTDEELRNAIAAAADGSDLQEQIDALQNQLDAFNTDQATLEVASGNLVLTNEDGSKSTIALSKLAKVSAAAGNSAEVRADGIYVPTVQAGNNGFDKISPDANNIIVNKANGLYAPKTAIKGSGGVTITGKGTPEDPFVVGGEITTVEGYLPKDVGVSCDPAIQMKTAVKIDTIATWASPAVITSTKGSTYSHSLTAHGEYESEDSVQYIASLDIVSPKQINFTVFHPELNYRANYYNGHVYLDVGLRAGQTFDGNKEIVFDVTEGECDDNVVGWVDGKKIYGRDIESPKFGEGEAPGGNGTPFAVRNGHEIYAPIDFADVEFYNKAGEKVKFTLSRGIVAKNGGLLGRQFFWYFAHSERPEIVEALKVDSMRGYYYLPPDQIDFDKEVLVTILFDRRDSVRVDMRYDGEEGKLYDLGTPHPSLGNTFQLGWDHWNSGNYADSSYTKGKGEGAYYYIGKNYSSTATIKYPDNLTLLKYVGERASDKGQTVRLTPAEFKYHFVDNGIRFVAGGVLSSSDSVHKDPRIAFDVRTPFYTEFPDQWFPEYPHSIEQAKKELTEMGFPLANVK